MQIITFLVKLAVPDNETNGFEQDTLDCWSFRMKRVNLNENLFELKKC
jgi:hypothetical protein